MSERPENDQKLVEEVKKYKDQNLIVYTWLMRALLTKKIQFEEEKSKIRFLWTQLNFIERFNWIYGGLIARRIDF
jgi:adenylate kinase family enzyme